MCIFEVSLRSMMRSALFFAFVVLFSVQHIQAQMSLNSVRPPFFGEPYVYERVQLSAALEAVLTTRTTAEGLIDVSTAEAGGVFDTVVYYTSTLLPDTALRFAFPANVNWFVRSDFNDRTEYRGLQYVSENQQIFELGRAEFEAGQNRFSVLPYDLPVQLVGVPFNTTSVTLLEPLAGQIIGVATGVRGRVETSVLRGGPFRSKDFRLDSSIVVRTTYVLLDSVADGLALATERMRDTTYAVYAVGSTDRAGWVPYFRYNILQDMRSGMVTRSAFSLAARGVLPRTESVQPVLTSMHAYSVPAVVGELITLVADFPSVPLTCRLINPLGQTIFTTALPVEGSPDTRTFRLPDALASGVYHLAVFNRELMRSIRILVVDKK
jgi:hypothetical protein